MSLHDELQRLADTAPRPDVDDAVWDRGRALRRRDRVVTSALVLVLVLVVGGVGTLLAGPPRAVAPATDTVPEGAIPSRINDVPEGAVLPDETDLAIGQASVAFTSSAGRPVVITASDGTYHPLRLPQWRQDSVLAISPSGTRLAWLSSSGQRTADPELTVLTTTNGETATTTIVHGAGLRPSALSWSPDGTRLGWLGGMPGGGSTFGTVDVAAARSEAEAKPSKSGLVGIAVANDGTVALGTTSGGLILDADERVSRKVAESDGSPANFSPDGAVLALENRWIPSPDSSTFEVATGKQWRHPFPADTLEPATTRPLGWLDEGLQLILAQESVDDDAEFIITTPRAGQTSTWRRSVGFADQAVVSSLSVAVDVVPDPDGTTSQSFTHDFGEPDWREESPGRLPLILGALMALLAGLAFIRMLRYQR